MANNSTGVKAKPAKLMMDPAHVLFGMLQTQSLISIWLHDSDVKYEGVLLGLDEHMNIVVGDAREQLKGKSTLVGTVLLKGDAISLVCAAQKK